MKRYDILFEYNYRNNTEEYEERELPDGVWVKWEEANAIIGVAKKALEFYEKKENWYIDDYGDLCWGGGDNGRAVAESALERMKAMENGD
jgi:hypothetical protein